MSNLNRYSNKLLALLLLTAAAMTTLTAISLWVGWTMLNLEEEPDEPAGNM